MESGDPFRLIDVLVKHEVPLVVIGGHAVAYHGYLRATEDTDIVVLRTGDSEAALYRALVELNARWIGDEIDPATGLERTWPVSPEYIRATRLMMLLTDEGFLDVFDYVPGYPHVAVDELLASSQESGGRKFVSLEWLRRMKQAAGRPKDRIDLENLPGE
ncbi:MAG: hypothetical protein GXY83_17455 [Rhodopirellula sp.]|nr:hypothetical protein [Rhodopirellula sp.]